jgi:hypothetical protein
VAQTFFPQCLFIPEQWFAAVSAEQEGEAAKAGA